MTSQPPHDGTTPLGHERDLIAQAREAARTSAKADPLPESIGPYKILQILGEGGMGVVYLAEQRKPIHRRVALKLIRVGMDTHQVIARFEAEREALAVLNHPNIAKVFDAGATEHGRPYFVMEHVSGVPIAQYCDEHRFRTEERLRLFIQVCHAVQHAHQKGIVHRDIKPSNVLVTEVDDQPVAKVIDFGIAKATQQALTEKTLFTQQGQFIGTPAYMSPEQADPTGIDIDTRTDVYSLGVLLYELLVGTLPFDPETLRNAAFAEMQRLIREIDPQKPSARLTGLGDALTMVAEQRRSARTVLLREIRGDLDWIVMKCLEKDRTRRYDTVSGLIAELQRHLNHEPVLAGPPSVSYRFRKFVRRNRLPVGAALGIFVTLATGLAISVMLYFQTERARIEATHQRDRANTEAQTASAVTDFLVNLFEVADPNESRGNTVTVREVLDEGATKIERDLTFEPLVRARLFRTLGRVYTRLSLFSLGQELCQKAVEVYQAAGRTDRDYIAALNDLGNSLTCLHRYDDALRILNEARQLATTTLPDDDLELAINSNHTSSALLNSGRLAEAAEHDRKALAIRRKRLGNEHPDVAQSIGNLAVDYWALGNFQEAERLFGESLAMRRKLLGEDHPDVLADMNNFANLMSDMGKPEEAERTYRKLLPLTRKIFGEESMYYPINLGNLSGALLKQGRYAEAEQFSRDALELRRKVHGPESLEIGLDLRSLAEALSRQGKHDEAEQMATECVRIFRIAHGDDNLEVADGLNTHANLLTRSGKREAADTLYHEGLAIKRKHLPTDHPGIATVLYNCGKNLAALERHQEAEELLRESLGIREKKLSPGNGELVLTQAALGQELVALQRFEEAEPLLLTAHNAMKNNPKTSDERKAQLLRTLIELYESWGKPEKADALRAGADGNGPSPE